MKQFLTILSPGIRRLFGGTIILLVIALALPPALYAAPAAKPAPGADATPGNSAAQGSEAAPITDLYALGLSKKPGESAEEILLRAHAGDTTAMALAVVGYDLGLNGFPRDRLFALSWAYMAQDWGAPVMAGFLRAYLARNLPAPDDLRLARFLASKYGQGSVLETTFKKTGLFDLENWLKEDGPDGKPRSTEDEAAFAAYAAKHEVNLNQGRDTMVRYRSAVNQALGKDDEALFSYEMGLDAADIRRYLHFIATSHDPEKESPDWKTERLFSFIEQRYKGDSGSYGLVSDAVRVLLSHDPAEGAAEVVRRAHAGEPEAMRRMAVNYLSGDMGFGYARWLSKDWYELAALAGDVPSMLALAENGRRLTTEPVEWDYSKWDADTWAWASLAAEYGDEEQRALAAWMLRAIEARISPEALSKARARLAEYREKIESGRAPEAERKAAAPS